jgi:hypothetical protein
MKNRLSHILKDWAPAAPPPAPEHPAEEGQYPLPRGINMLIPVELCINRELLITLLTASIQEIHQHRSAKPHPGSTRELAELEAVLQQQLLFRAWAKDHPSSYISIALYPVTELEAAEDMDEDGELF